MSHVLTGGRRRRWTPPVSLLTLVELLVLAPLAALLVLWLVPTQFEIEWSCVGSLGAEGTRGDSFARVVTVVGTAGWVAAFLAMLYASIAERPRLAALIPLVWFVGLVGATTLAAAMFGPAPCPS